MARVWRRTLTALLGVAVGAGVIVAAGLPVYVFPPSQPAGRADVVMVLGPPTNARIDLALQLRDEGTADSILLSVPPPGQPSGDMDICDEEGITCETPRPFTTAGEAILLDEYADTHDVDRALVITYTPHVARTRHIFDVCADTETAVVELPADMGLWAWAWQYAYQTGAFAKALVLPCQ